jgi:hypothetical protein
MPYPHQPRLLKLVLLLTLAVSIGSIAFGRDARSQESASNAARQPPNFSRLQVKPGSLSFKRVTTKNPAPESRSFEIRNNGKGTTNLNVVVGSLTGNNPGSFSIASGGGTLPPLAPGASATVTVQFAPSADGHASAEIPITSDATKGKATHTVKVSGSAKGVTSSPTPTATPTPSGGPVSTDRNSANAPAVTISGQTVSVIVPLGSDDNNTHGALQVVVEGASPLPSPAMLATDRSNSCAAATSGETVCSGQGGTVDLIPAGSSTPAIIPLSNGTVPDINFAVGDCMGCGAMVDDNLSLAIISSGLGFVPVQLPSGTLMNPIATDGTNARESVGEVFGYDAADHLILSANYTVDPNNGFSQTPPHFQIINISNPGSPLVYELANDQAVFLNNGHSCSGTDSDKLPDVTAYDPSTHIAYVTFHTPSVCFNAPPDDIAMFDLSQATFNGGTWTTPSIAIQSITGTDLNGIDPISVEAVHHLALVSAGDSAFGVLQLPSASGSGSTLSIPDWVNADMPNDPDGATWAGWHQPAGLATYVSPTSGKVMGVMMNRPGASGPTFLAIVDMDDMLNPAVTMRDPSNSHKVDSSVNLLTSGLVRFVQVQ